MKRILYENYLMCYHIGMTLAQVNTLEDYEREHYISEIEKYLQHEQG